MDFPLRENCDPNNPEEAFLWMLVALPQQNGGQLVMPVTYLRQVSRRLWDCGARPAAEPTIRYVRPPGNGPHWLTNPGTWLPRTADEPAGRPGVHDFVAALTAEHRAELLAALQEETE